jgi:Flp pilus assembly protein TadD
MKDRAGELEPFADEAGIQPLISFLSFDPRNAPAGEMLAVLRAARSGQSQEDTVAKLRAAADKYPTFLPLQVAAARGHLKMGQAPRAEQVARRAAATFPDDVEAVRLLASVYGAQGKWQELRETALLWRRLSPGDTLEPDLVLARVQLNSNDAAGAAERLAPRAKAEAAKALAGEQEASAETIDLYARALIAQGNADAAAAMLEPLARKSASWRRLWLDLAGAFRSRELEAAAAWVRRVEPAVPTDAPRERVALAGAWYVLGHEFNDREALQTARAIAEPFTADANVAAEAWTLLASCDEGLGNLGPAEQEYRKAMQLRPDHTDLMNNLAYVLLLKSDGKSLEEARTLSEKATKGAPSVASYYDTLARIESRLGNTDAAVTHFNRALSLDASSLEAMIGLADVLSRTGRRGEARQQLAQIDAALQSSPRLSHVLAKQLETVRTTVQNQVESGRVE